MYILIGILILIIFSIAWYLKETLSKLDDLRLMFIEQADELDKTETNLKNIRIKIEEEFQAQFEAWKQVTEATIRADTLKRSQSVQHGFVSEQLVPFIQTKFSPKDMRFIGGVIDYIAFDGLSDYNNSKEVYISLIDIKTGNSSLSTRQRRVRDAIIKGNINFVIINPDSGKYKEFSCQTTPVSSDKILED